MVNILPSFYILDVGRRFTPYLYIDIYIYRCLKDTYIGTVTCLSLQKQTRNGRAMWFRQESTAILIADLDGLRSSLCLKGSAGIKPCLRCLNCVKKDSGLDPMHYPDITNPSFAQFRQIQNKDIWNLADALQKMVDDGESKAKIQKFEKAAGLVFVWRWIVLSTQNS